tara:strand:- start:89 stop:676 length:588 start_codon:yes stop_codon:yes gene_type:complete
MKKLISILSILTLTSCANYENYYLNNYSVDGNLQSKHTAELAFKNVIYAQVLDRSTSVEQFGPDGDHFTVVYFSVENIGEDVAYYSFKNAFLSNEETGKIRSMAKLAKVLPSEKLNFNDEDSYRNPFEDTEMEDNNFAYNISNKVLTDFSLQPNESKKGFLLFDYINEPSDMQFTLSSGVSIYTTRPQTVKLDTE